MNQQQQRGMYQNSHYIPQQQKHYKCPCCCNNSPSFCFGSGGSSRSGSCSISDNSNWWNVIVMGRMIGGGNDRQLSMILLCGLLICFTVFAPTAVGATEITTQPNNALLEDTQTSTSTTSSTSTQIPGNCSQVKCPPVESCPEDSYRLPSLVMTESHRHSREKNALSAMMTPEQQSCCPGPSTQKCQCIPDLLCAPKECPTGWVAHVSRNATGKPGGCCPKFECLQAPSSSSSSSGESSSKSNHAQHHPHSHHQPHKNYHHLPQKLRGALHPSEGDSFDRSSSDIGFDLSSLEDDDDINSSDDNSEDDELSDEDSTEDVLLRNSPLQQQLLSDDADDEKGHCYHDAKIYKSGESWTVQSDCSECFCERGLVSCKPISCNVPAECRLARAQPLSCCPVCDGCVSGAGKAYNMSEVWQEDPCTNCTCQGGRIQCHTSSCKRQHSCSNPKYYAGECCPRCENEAPEIGSAHTFDKDSCPFRECHRDISCPNGFRLDKSGCPTCECQKCQSLLGCKRSCTRGFKVDTFGCTVCECRGESTGVDPANNNLIPFSSKSSPWSRNGNNGQANQQDKQGKEISSSSVVSASSGSREDDDQSSSSSPYSPSVKVDQRNLLGNPGGGGGGKTNKDLNERDGQHHQFQYHNGGNRHYSHHSPHHNDDHDEDDDHNDDGLYGYGYGSSNEAKGSGGSSSSSATSTNSRSAAGVLVLFCTLDSDGVRRMEGEEWSDHCRRCVCRNGKEMCSLITCQAPKCEHPIFYPGDCCPRCPVEETSIPFSRVNVSICLSSDGTERVEGEIWTLSSCLTCTCHSGQVLCAAPDCPPTPCMSPKLVDCCLQCPTSTPSNKQENESENSKDGQQPNPKSVQQSGAVATPGGKKCLSDDSVKTYSNGETWKVGACQSCRCETGQIKCFSAGKCPPLECSRPVLAKNQCCPICLEKVVHKNAVHHGVEGAFELHHLHGNGGNLINHDLHHDGSTTTTTASRVPGGGLEPHCAVLIACLLVVTILLSLYIVRQVCFHRRVSRRLIKKVPVGFHSSSSSSHSPSVTPDCCYKCDYSKYCDSGGCVIVGGTGSSSSSTTGGVGGGCTGSTSRGGGGCVGGGGSSRASSTNGSNGHLSSEQKPLFQHHHQHSDHLLMENQSVSSSVIPNTPTPPPGGPGLTQSLLRDSDKV